MTYQDFNEFGFDDRILRILDETGHHKPTPIQSEAIPALLEGKDLMGIAQTGTGKTAAFALPAIQRLAEKNVKLGPREIRALILAPTRELVVQIEKNCKTYARYMRLKHLAVYGGTSYRPQISALRRGGSDILVATPGRLIDLLESGHIELGFLELFILDEGDRMLDMGFINDIRKLTEYMPADRQSIFFSATMPPKVKDLANTLLNNPVHVEISPESTPVDRIDQKVMFVNAKNKLPLLLKMFKNEEWQRVIIFTKTKYKADKVADHLSRAGFPADAIHGDKSQSKRERVLNAFRKGKINALVATDVAARGIDVSDISHVINYELPLEPESYVHRIGRTARAGSKGHAIAFCDSQERSLLRFIEKIMDMKLPVDEDHEFHEEVKSNKGGNGGQKRRDRRPRSESPFQRAKGPKDRRDRNKDKGRPRRDRKGAEDSANTRSDSDRAAKGGYEDRPRSDARPSKNRWDAKKGKSDDRSDRDRPARFERSDRSDRSDRFERSDRSDRFARSDRSDRSDRKSEGSRFSKDGDRPARRGKPDFDKKSERRSDFGKPAGKRTSDKRSSDKHASDKRGSDKRSSDKRGADKAGSGKRFDKMGNKPMLRRGNNSSKSAAAAR